MRALIVVMLAALLQGCAGGSHLDHSAFKRFLECTERANPRVLPDVC